MFSQINHGTSFGVFVFIHVLFSTMRFFKNSIGTLILNFRVPIFILSLFFSDWPSIFYLNFLSKEVDFIIFRKFFLANQNIEDLSYLFHGRVGRWLIYFEDFSRISFIKTDVWWLCH